MSLVLAFGLSPLGQVPAYADEPAKAPTAELQAQADRTFVFADTFELYSESATEQGTYDVPVDTAKLAYNGGDQVFRLVALDSGNFDISNVNTDGPVPDQGTVGATVQYYKAELKYTEGGASVACDAEAEDANGGFLLTFDKAGEYTLTLTGVGTNAAGQKYRNPKEYKINVAKLDISGFGFSQVGVAPDFTGKEQAVAVQLATEGEAALSNYKAKSGETLVVGDGQNESVQGKIYYYTAGNPATYTLATNADLKASIANTVDKTDFEFAPLNVVSADDHQIAVTGAGSCTGTAYATFTVGQANLADGATTVVNEFAAGVWDAAQFSGKTYATLGQFAEEAQGEDPAVEAAYVPVFLNQVDDPISVTFNGVELTEGDDYTVAYYTLDEDHPWTLPSQTLSAPKKKVGDKYYAVITTVPYGNFVDESAQDDQSNSVIVAACEVQSTGTIEAFAKSAVIATGTYLGGSAVEIPKSATFKDASGNDVTSTVGANWQVKPNTGFSILATTTANTARVENGKPVGAGDYTVKVTGKENYDEGDGVDATFKVEPRIAKEGTAVGDLKVTANPLPYQDGKYVDPDVKVEMYTSEEGLTEIDPVEQEWDETLNDNAGGYKDWTGYLGQKVTNYTVEYYKDDKRVTKPSEQGTYKAVFKFSGNLEGTPDIEKTFEVQTGKIESLVSSIQVKGFDWETYGHDSTKWNNHRAYTGKPIELTKDDVVFVSKKSDVANTELTPDDLLGTDYTISFEKGNVEPDAATGLPKDAGNYIIKATFTGNYTGEITGRVVVDPLDLTKLTNGNVNNQVELQFQQDSDQSWNTTYVTGQKADGSAIVPIVRVVVKDGKQKTAEATVVDGAVYTATFSDNTTADKSPKVKLAANAGYEKNVKVTAADQLNAFKITEKTFAGIGATVTLGKTSVDYKDAGVVTADGVTLRVDSNLGALAYGTDYALTAVNPEGETVEVTAVATGDGNDDFVNVKLNDADLKDAGEYTIYVSPVAADPVYGGSVPAKFTINPVDLSDSSKYAITYTMTKNNEDVITPITSEWSTTYTPNQAKTIAGITLADDKLYVTPATGRIGTDSLQRDTHYTVSYKDNHAAGTMKLTIEGKGNYGGKIEKEVTIKRAALNAAGYRIDFITTPTFKKTAAGVYYTDYTGQAITPEYEVNHVNGDTVDYMLDDAYSAQWINNTDVMYDYNSTDVGAYATLKITATGNYEGSIEQAFRIDPIDLAKASNVEIAMSDVKYTGEANLVPTATVKVNGNALTQGKDFDVTSINDGKVGVQTAMIASPNKGNITVSTPISKEFNIVKGDSEVTLAAKSFTYSGKAIAMSGAKVTGSTGAVTYKYFSDKAATKEISAPKAGGTYYATATVAADDNYNEATSAAAKVTINPAKNSKFKVTAKKKSFSAKAKKATTLKAKALYKVTSKAGKVTYKKASGDKKITVASNGNIKVAKGLKAGKTYTVKVKATSAKNANYKAASSTVAIKVKVAK